MSAGKDEAITVDPARALWIVRKRVSEEHGTDLSTTEREAEVARRARVDRIDGESAGLVSCFGKEERLERHGS